MPQTPSLVPPAVTVTQANTINALPDPNQRGVSALLACNEPAAYDTTLFTGFDQFKAALDDDVNADTLHMVRRFFVLNPGGQLWYQALDADLAAGDLTAFLLAAGEGEVRRVGINPKSADAAAETAAINLVGTEIETLQGSEKLFVEAYVMCAQVTYDPTTATITPDRSTGGATLRHVTQVIGNGVNGVDIDPVLGDLLAVIAGNPLGQQPGQPSVSTTQRTPGNSTRSNNIDIPDETGTFPYTEFLEIAGVDFRTLTSGDFLNLTAGKLCFPLRYKRINGVYFHGTPTLEVSGGTYGEAVWNEVINEASAIAYLSVAQNFLNGSLSRDVTTGLLTDDQRLTLQNKVTADLEAQLGGLAAVSGIRCIVPPNQDVSTNTVAYNVEVALSAVAKTNVITLSFVETFSE